MLVNNEDIMEDKKLEVDIILEKDEDIVKDVINFVNG